VSGRAPDALRQFLAGYVPDVMVLDLDMPGEVDMEEDEAILVHVYDPPPDNRPLFKRIRNRLGF
jgi:CheY-like chemotaxis protein